MQHTGQKGRRLPAMLLNQIVDHCTPLGDLVQTHHPRGLSGPRQSQHLVGLVRVKCSEHCPLHHVPQLRQGTRLRSCVLARHGRISPQHTDPLGRHIGKPVVPPKVRDKDVRGFLQTRIGRARNSSTRTSRLRAVSSSSLAVTTDPVAHIRGHHRILGTQMLSCDFPFGWVRQRRCISVGALHMGNIRKSGACDNHESQP
mmetsp:Transcript_11683/g.32461  ORF Transcript_11683/g.32461 Transcript_11683/m.32461 type:complete len:200 (-) Transcript_11683:7-606(-)